jgi:SAM-dependent methyltransferase
MTDLERAANMRSVRDELGYNQGWSGGLATQVRSERRCDLLISEMTVDRKKSVLEIGCGRGEIARRLGEKTGMHVLGIDRSPSFVSEARAHPAVGDVHFEVMDFTSAEELSGRSFDYIVGNGILHHLYEELGVALSAMRALLSPGGKVVFLEPNLHNPYVYAIFTRPRLRRLARLEPDEMAFSRRFALEHLRGAGFEDAQVEYRDFLLPGVPAWLIQPLITIGRYAERTPGIRQLAQSLFISARS